MTRTITALFDSQNDADRAREQLGQIGFVHDIDIHAASPAEEASFAGRQGGQGSEAHTQTGGGQGSGGGGMFGSLKKLFMPEEDRSTYEEGLRRGHVLLSINVDESRADEVVRLLEKNTEALDVDSKAEEWKQGGWDGPRSSTESMAYDTPTSSSQASYASSGQTLTGSATSQSLSGASMSSDMNGDGFASTSGSAGSTSSMLGGGGSGSTSARFVPDESDRDVVDFQPVSSMSGSGGSIGSGLSQSQSQTIQAGQEERIPIVEERLAVGKREVERGGARVRSYVVEQPVHEQVRLREEHTSIERRPVDQPLSAADDAFRERSIETRDTVEEAVVGKEARVREELVVRKEQDERTETIDDTVRHTEVDVDEGGLGENRSFQRSSETTREGFTDDERRSDPGLGRDPDLTSRP